MSTTTEPRTVIVTVPMAPPAALSPNRRGSEHWRYRQQAALELRSASYVAVVHEYQGLPETIDQPVTIHEHIIWPKSKGVLPDPDALPTYCKAALDGIVDAGIIASDSAKHVVSVTASQEKGPDAQGCIVITIQEVTE